MNKDLWIKVYVACVEKGTSLDQAKARANEAVKDFDDAFPKKDHWENKYYKELGTAFNWKANYSALKNIIDTYVIDADDIDGVEGEEIRMVNSHRQRLCHLRDELKRNDHG